MTTESLLGALISGLAVWAITKVIAFFVMAARIRAALLEDARINLAGAQEQLEAVKKLVEDNVIEGQKPPFQIPYHVGEYLLYHSMQGDLPLYLSGDSERSRPGIPTGMRPPIPRRRRPPIPS